MNEMLLVCTDGLIPWTKTTKVVNYPASPSSLRPYVQPTANSTSWRWGRIILAYVVLDVCVFRSTAWHQLYQYVRWVYFSTGLQSMEQRCGGAVEWQPQSAIILLPDPEEDHHQLYLDIPTNTGSQRGETWSCTLNITYGWTQDETVQRWKEEGR